MKKIISFSFLLFCFASLVMGQSQIQISYSHSPSIPCANSPVFFQASVTPSSPWVYYQWDFGDGNYDYVANPTHMYTAPGTYNVMIYAWDSLSASSDTIYFSLLVDSSCANYDYVTGHVYHDLNANGVEDTGEPGVQGVMIEINPGNFFVTTDQNGDYGFYQNSGSWTLSMVTPPYGTQTAPTMPSTYSVTTGSTGSTHGGNDFGLDYIAVQDLEVNVYSGPPVPGFNRYYSISYWNSGTVVMSGTVDFTFDPAMTYVSSSTGGIQSGNTVSFSYSNLAPGEYRYAWVLLNADTNNVSLGDTLCFSGQINPIAGDSTPANNVDSYCQVAVGSYDPNDKQVAGGEGAIQQGQNLEYTVRFQNTGTWYATNVTVRDTLDSNLDLSTFDMQGASHAFNWNIHGNVLTVNFPNIHLPDSNTNEPASHGWLRYSVDPKPGLADQTHIYNTAGIYFDFNAPVITNTTDNWIDLVTAVSKDVISQFDAVIYPNPTVDRATLKFNNPDHISHTLRLVNINGQVVRSVNGVTGEEIVIERNELPAGLYIWQLTNEQGGVKSGKLVIE